MTDEYNLEAPMLQFMKALYAFLSGYGQPDATPKRISEGIASTLKDTFTSKAELRPDAPAVVRQYLPAALLTARDTDKAEELAIAFEKLTPFLSWTTRPGSEASEAFHLGHANALVVGPAGRALWSVESVWVGVTLLAPHVAYPFHQHRPAEAYVALSTGDWFNDLQGWWTPGAGAIVCNESNAKHAMRASGAPLLAIWSLWDSGRPVSLQL
jgi:hypothetical protein